MHLAVPHYEHHYRSSRNVSLLGENRWFLTLEHCASEPGNKDLYDVIKNGKAGKHQEYQTQGFLARATNATTKLLHNPQLSQSSIGTCTVNH